MKILELFGGIGACSKALERLGIDYEIADYVEIDKYAVKSFNAIHNTNFEPQDITTWDKDIKVDLIMHGSPCQDFSLAGKQTGGDKDSGTRSSLMYETIRIVEKLKPKYVIWENVKNLISKKHKHNFDAYLETMEQLGYKNYYQVLNAKDYGIPQNRERVFTISIRKNVNKVFTFPPKQELKLKLKDMLEEKVDEKYYLSEDKIKQLVYEDIKKIDTSKPQVLMGIGEKKSNSGTQWYQQDRVYDDNIAIVVTTSFNPYYAIKNNTKQGYLDAHDGDGVYINVSTKRRTVQKDMIQTLTTFQDKGVVVKDKICETRYDEGIRTFKNDICGTIRTIDAGGNKVVLNYPPLRIRKLTPKECWRLMGFDDEDFEKASKVNSNSQLYKQAGNSIVVNVLEAIFRRLLLNEDN